MTDVQLFDDESKTDSSYCNINLTSQDDEDISRFVICALVVRAHIAPVNTLAQDYVSCNKGYGLF